MYKLDPNFSRDPISLVAFYDPREMFFGVGFADFETQWSYDHDSVLAAFTHFVEGTNHVAKPEFSVKEILAVNPKVTVGCGQEALDMLEEEARNSGDSIEQAIARRLGVERVATHLVTPR